MRIASIQKLSLIDYPGKISSVIFTQGCNFRCGYCHNPRLVLPNRFENTIFKEDVIRFLKTRVGKIEGVVITGGEPTIHTDLIFLIKEIRTLGFSIKLDTNGSNPKILKEIIDSKLVDFIAMDIKAPLSKYSLVCGVDVDLEKIKESIVYIKKTEIEKQFRITVVKGMHSTEDFSDIKELIQSNITVQNFYFSGDHIDGSLSKANEFNLKELNEYI